MKFDFTKMARIGNVLISFFISLLCLENSVGLQSDKLLSAQSVTRNTLPLAWLYQESPRPLIRVRRENLNRSGRDTKLIDEPGCSDDIKRLCGALPPDSDDLTVLECIQTFKVKFQI